jgi:hypothetical protein
MFRAIAFFGLITPVFASATLDVLVNAAASFSATIQQQLEMVRLFQCFAGGAARIDENRDGQIGAAPLSSTPLPRRSRWLAKTRRWSLTKRRWFC